MPIVVLDDEIDGVQHDSVMIDQREGALSMMRHVVEVCGATRVFFVGGLETNIDTQARYKAYRDTLRKAGLKFNKEDVYHLDYTYESAYRLAMDNVRAWAGPKHCVFAANDEMAAGIIAGANAMKVAVPDDLGVVGFDDTRVAQMTKPLLDDSPRADVEHGRQGHRAVVPTDRRAGPPAGQSLAAGEAGSPRIVRLRSEEMKSHAKAPRTQSEERMNHEGTRRRMTKEYRKRAQCRTDHHSLLCSSR